MNKIKFPKTIEKPSLYWKDADGFVALVKTKDTIILYLWDGFSSLWNKKVIFEKVDLK